MASLLSSYRPYIYLPLCEKSIRLITLSPSSGDHSTPLHIELVDIVLDDQTPSYQALSYAWEDQKPTRLILCDRKGLMVTENCHEALQELQRSCTTRRYLWIDAICINQDNKTEKSLQVSMMGQIYSKARRVLVWLGSNSSTLGQFQIYINLWRGYMAAAMAQGSKARRPGLQDLQNDEAMGMFDELFYCSSYS
jgi:hypothetical protein